MSFEKVKKGLCPNDCGKLTILEKPIAKLYLIPEDLCDLGEFEGTETPEDMFGYLVAICSKCGYVLGTSPTYEFDYDAHEWRRCSEEAKKE